MVDGMKNREEQVEREECENEVRKGNEVRCEMCNKKLGVCGYLEKENKEDQSKKWVCMKCGERSGLEREIEEESQKKRLEGRGMSRLGRRMKQVSVDERREECKICFRCLFATKNK